MDELTEQPVSCSQLSCASSIVRVDDILWTGLELWKIPFHTVGNPQRRILKIKDCCNRRKKGRHIRVQVARSPTRTQMESAIDPLTIELIDTARKSSSKHINLKDVMDVKEGQNTHAFQAFKARHGKSAIPLSNLCFSIICHERTFDFFTEGPSLTTMMVEALRRLLNQVMSSLPTAPLRNLTIAKLRNKMDPALNEKHFFKAAKCGDAEAFLWYLEHGISVDTMESDDRKDTALIAACRLGRSNIVEIALEFNAKNDPHPQFGQTALQVAIASGHVDCARLILETAAHSGADRTIVNHEDVNKEAPIHVASRCGNIGALELLIDHGANMTLVDVKGRSCLHCATQSGYHMCLNFLLCTGCNSIMEQRDDQGYTCLHMAVKGNKLECARVLLQHGAAIDAITIDGSNVFHLAEKQKSEKMLQILLQFDSIRINPRNEIPPVDAVTFDNDEANEFASEDDDLFRGMSLFNIFGGVRTPQKQMDMGYSGLDSTHIDNQMTNPDQWASGNYYYEEPRFYLNNELWFICFSSGHYYYLREVDHHSQWYDPRDHGIILDVDHTSDSDNVANPTLYINEGNIQNQDNPKIEYFDHTIPRATASIAGKSHNDSISPLSSFQKLRTSGPPINVNSEESQSVNLDTNKESLTENQSFVTKEIPVERRKASEVVDSQNAIASNPNIMIKSENLSKYKNMTTVGIPIQSVEHTMKADGDHQDEVDISLRNQPDPGTNDETGQSNPKEASVEKVESTSLKVPEAQVDSLLLKYRKMVAVGIPLESVKHKMKVDGMNSDTVQAFFSAAESRNNENLASTVLNNTSKTSSEIESTNNGVSPLRIIKVASESKNNVAQISSKNIGDNTVANSKRSLIVDECKKQFEGDSDLTKFRKMISFGIPHQFIANKMRQEGVAESKIVTFEIAFGLKEEEAKATEEHLESDAKGAIDVNEYKKRFEGDAELTKFRKMISVGVPHQFVANKMRQEGVAESKIDTFEIAFGLKKSTKPYQSSQKVHPTQKLGGLPMPPPRRTSVKMQKIHWKAVSEEKVGNSLWADTTDYDSDIDDKEVKQLESLFGALQAKPIKSAKKISSRPSSNIKNSCLIDMKRANNIAISLAQYRSYQNYDDLCKAVVSMDSSRLSAEQLQNMKALLPTNDELKKMKLYKGGTEGLVRAELFFLSVSKFPRFAQKLETFIFSLLFRVHITELQDSLTKLEKACKDIVSNKRLASILRKLLAVGNLVNEGAGKPRARGITVDSLLKTAKRTGSDGKTTVIYIVVSNFLKQDNTGESVEFWNEMTSVRDASRIDIKDCKNSLKEMQMGLKKANLTMETEKISLKENSNDNSTDFLKRCNDFIVIASQRIREIEEKLVDVDESVKSLCSFFAEDPRTCQATTIFALLLDFSKLVESSKDAYERKARAMKRKASMNTPIKVSRPVSSPMKQIKGFDSNTLSCARKSSIDSTLTSIVRANKKLSSQGNMTDSSWDWDEQPS